VPVFKNGWYQEKKTFLLFLLVAAPFFLFGPLVDLRQGSLLLLFRISPNKRSQHFYQNLNFSMTKKSSQISMCIEIRDTRMLSWPDIRPAGYPVNLKAGYWISSGGRIPVPDIQPVFKLNRNISKKIFWEI
jgi:hypothetical protein